MSKRHDREKEIRRVCETIQAFMLANPSYTVTGLMTNFEEMSDADLAQSILNYWEHFA